jgi:hypothetical protein
VFGGVVYDYVGRVPGSGAEIRAYYNTYFCNICLRVEYHRLDGSDDSYSHVKFNATPKEVK